MAKTHTVIFAAGCFWGVQDYFDKVPGVLETIVGYTGGTTPNPTYEAVCTQQTGHAEATRITFDPDQISYEQLVRQFFRMHDPTQVNRQGADVGSSYRSAIFYQDDEQKDVAAKVIRAVAKDYNKPIATQLSPVGEFYKAEEYHQKFVQKNGYGACHVPFAPITS